MPRAHQPGRPNLHRGVARGKAGFRPDLGRSFRSGWEANYARYLEFLRTRGEIRSWRYEPRRFLFRGETRGAVAYTPDFEVVSVAGRTTWVEVKGWLDPRSKATLRKFRRYYPTEAAALEIIDEKRYRTIERQIAGLVPHWEGSGGSSSAKRGGSRVIRMTEAEYQALRARRSSSSSTESASSKPPGSRE